DGLPTSDKLKILTKEKGLDSNFHSEINNLKQKYTLDIFKEKCLPDPKQIEMLNKLKKHYKLCLCSNSKRKTVEVFLSKSDTASFFDFYLSNEDVSKSKPDPEIYNKAIKMLNLSPQQCLIVEDNFN